MKAFCGAGFIPAPQFLKRNLKRILFKAGSMKGGRMDLFRKIFSFFQRKKIVKLLKRQNDDWNRSLKRFEIISIDCRVAEQADALRGHKRYSALLQSFDMNLQLALYHNREIGALQKQFDEMTEKHTAETILADIDRYPVSQLRAFNETALRIGGYTIPDSFPNKKKYLSYIRDIGELLNDYDAIVEQHSLIRDFDALSFCFPDRYLDASAGESALMPARELIEKIKKFGSKYYAIPQLDEKIIERHNEQYIRDHLNDEVFDNVNGISLDEEQRRSVLCDAKSNLVIAGAGTGKTLTVCGKVKWLLERQGVRGEDILLLSYSKASADDLAAKVAGICADLTVKTFHSFGLEVLNQKSGKRMAVEDQFKSYIKKFFDEQLGRRFDLAQLVFNFFSFYLYDDSDGKRYETEGKKYEDLKSADYRTLKDRLRRLNSDPRRLETLQKEYVKSYEELVIANFLFVNGIAYEYERPYEVDTSTPEKRQYLPDFYLSEHHIYLEHYGVNKNWETPQYSREEEEKYLEGIQWKRETHRKYNTVCIETYSYEFHDGTIFDHLRQRLAEKGIECRPMTKEDIMDALHSIYMGQEFSSLFNLISTFVSLYKAQFRDDSGFETLKNTNGLPQFNKNRVNAFLDICKEIYNYYIGALRAENKIDFDDMILQATELLAKMPGYRYKYVIVDEFQDISKSRAELLKAVISHGNSKLFAVGDDWQAIYRFAGCDINIFLHFERYFDDVKFNYITSTHRNSMELQAVVEPFITANPEQYVKHIRSEIHETLPVRIIYHDNDRAAAFMQALANLSKTDPAASVLVLGRNYHDIDPILCRSGITLDRQGVMRCEDVPHMKITYSTVHRSKGLESGSVILISGEDARNGFPNKMEDDCLLDLILGEKSNFEFAEERRLFYVALTRTRSIVYILCDKRKPSAFVKEIEARVKIENPELLETGKPDPVFCPRCKSGKLILRNVKESMFYGCSNFPYCRYMIADQKAVLTNNRCPDCGDFLVIRNGRYGKFIGCHNYPYCKFTRRPV